MRERKPSLSSIIITRDDKQTRRRLPHRLPPYITPEGFVLVDRRENGDRRKSQPWQHTTRNPETATPKALNKSFLTSEYETPDTVPGRLAGSNQHRGDEKDQNHTVNLKMEFCERPDELY